MTLIHVTNKDILAGKRARKHGDTTALCSCPVAQALNRQVPQSDGWRVNGRALYYWIDKLHATSAKYHVPRSVDRFISTFDDKRPVKPFSFILKPLVP
jgi:hypothetical protein